MHTDDVIREMRETLARDERLNREQQERAESDRDKSERQLIYLTIRRRLLLAQHQLLDQLEREIKAHTLADLDDLERLAREKS